MTRAMVLVAVMAVIAGCGDEWIPSDREPYVIDFSWSGDCTGADRVGEWPEMTRVCEWGCAVESYNGEICQPVEIARWKHVYRWEGGRWVFLRQYWHDGCWEPQ